MIRHLFKPLALISCVMASVPVSAQEPYNLTAPVQNLATLFHDLFGPHGLIVDSEATLPGEQPHTAHFTSDCECVEWIAPMAGRGSASDVTFGWIQHAGARSRGD